MSDFPAVARKSGENLSPPPRVLCEHSSRYARVCEGIFTFSRQENRRDEDFLAVKIEASVPRVRDPAHAHDTTRADPRSIELFDVDPWSEMCFGRFGGHIQ